MSTDNKAIPEDFTSIIGNAAKEYVDNGYSVMPLSITAKIPIGKWKKYQTEYVTEEEIDSWIDNGVPCYEKETGEEYAREKVFNLGIITGAISGIVVVDCDNERAMEYAKEHGLTSPVAVKTRRGMHYYFRHPNNGRRYRNKVGSKPGRDWHNCPGLDFRGDGGQVVAPPSIRLNDDGTVGHQYIWSLAAGTDFDDMPIWHGTPDDMEMTEGFDFASLSLAEVSIGESATDVREQVQKRVDYLGRKLQGPDCGDGTDEWMIKFCGQMVRRGLVDQQLADAVAKFHTDYFIWKGSRPELEHWLKTKMRSATEMDRRNHPEDYDPVTKERKQRQEVEKVEQKEFAPIYSKDFRRLLDSLGDQEYHADPVVPSRSIIQVVGYNGHGKSFFVGSLATAMAANKPNFGPYAIHRPSKVFYLDFDNPARTVLKRFSGFADVHGDPGDNLPIWSPAIIPADHGGAMNLREAAGLEVLERWLNMVKPDVVVLDTVRNAFGGLDEKNPQDWFHVNRVAKIIRDRYKASVILVHHRNKPNEQGLGREAGSTAQLTDLDTQIIITQVYKDKNIARTKAGLFDEDLTIDRRGNILTPFGYFNQKLSNNHMQTTHRIRMVTEVSFGKVREETDLHKTMYLGWTENISTGEQGMLWTPSLREDTLALAAIGKTPDDIAQELFVPSDTIKKWMAGK